MKKELLQKCKLFKRCKQEEEAEKRIRIKRFFRLIVTKFHPVFSLIKYKFRYIKQQVLFWAYKPVQ